MKNKVFSLINRALLLFEVRKIKTKGKNIFLTFDDGPEPGITEFVLEELRAYNFHATFFCRGDNAEKNPELLEIIKKEGHAIGNHTYSHINSFKTNNRQYIKDVNKADLVLNTKLFRPPWGDLTLGAWSRLVFNYKYRIIYWRLGSGDTQLDLFDKEKSLKRLTVETRKGDVVLFHCCHRHENETRQLLPAYLKWLHNNDFNSISISL